MALQKLGHRFSQDDPQQFVLRLHPLLHRLIKECTLLPKYKDILNTPISMHQYIIEAIVKKIEEDRDVEEGAPPLKF